jgi:hypothetical protein
MNKTLGSSKIYSSFGEFCRVFYPKWSKSQDSGETEEASGRDLARYAVEKHFPLRAETDAGDRKTPSQAPDRR